LDAPSSELRPVSVVAFQQTIALTSHFRLALVIRVLVFRKWAENHEIHFEKECNEAIIVSRVTRLGELCPMDECFLWAGILKITEAAHILATLFPPLRLVLNKKCIGQHFGPFFHKLIRSPCIIIIIIGGWC
jgi:hypothetical protein